MTVLVIDDEKFIRKILESELRQENIMVALAEDGAEGFKQAKKVLPDIILLDMILPKKDGFEVLKDLKADDTTKDIPVIIFSTLGQARDIEEAMKLGAALYLSKDSYSLKQIVEEVKKMLTEQ